MQGVHFLAEIAEGNLSDTFGVVMKFLILSRTKVLISGKGKLRSRVIFPDQFKAATATQGRIYAGGTFTRNKFTPLRKKLLPRLKGIPGVL